MAKANAKSSARKTALFVVSYELQPGEKLKDVQTRIDNSLSRSRGYQRTRRMNANVVRGEARKLETA